MQITNYSATGHIGRSSHVSSTTFLLFLFTHHVDYEHGHFRGKIAPIFKAKKKKKPFQEFQSKAPNRFSYILNNEKRVIYTLKIVSIYNTWNRMFLSNHLKETYGSI